MNQTYTPVRADQIQLGHEVAGHGPVIRIRRIDDMQVLIRFSSGEEMDRFNSDLMPVA